MADDQITHPGDVVEKGKIKLPMWAWVVIGAGALGVGYIMYRKYQAGSAAATQQNSATPTTGTGSPLYSDPTTILPMFQGSSALTDQQFDKLAQDNPPLPYRLYTVTGKGSYKIPQASGSTSASGPVNDQWPTGVAIAAMGLSPNDIVNISYYAALITMENLGQLSPYPVGTTLRVPVNWSGPANLNNTVAPVSTQYLYDPNTSAGTSSPNNGQGTTAGK